MNYTTHSPTPHTHTPGNVNQFMRQVLLAMLPGVVVLHYFFGAGVLFNVFVAMAVALAAEAWMLRLRKKPMRLFLSDCSALITAALIAVSLPVGVPWWLVAVGAFFAIVIVKHLYGGLGQNVFNPAMAAYALLLVAFPMQMTSWPAPAGEFHAAPSFVESLRLFLGLASSDINAIDAMSAATPLDTLKIEVNLGYTAPEAMTQLHWGAWQWLNLAWLVGGVYLLLKRIIRWYIPVSMLAGMLVVASLFYFIAPDRVAAPPFYLFSGATMICAFFIATDPVTAATSPKGQIIYGAGIGILLYLIRVLGGYPDGVAFAVLLMNLTVPTIDYYTKTRVYGHPAS